MRNGSRKLWCARVLAAGSLAALALSLSTTAQAATDASGDAAQPTSVGASDAGSNDGTIIVTARRRDETVMTTPLDLNVIAPQQIKTQRIESLYDVAAVDPTVHVSRGFGLIGTQLFMRGIGSGDAAIYIDQSVGYAVDDIGLSEGVFYRAGAFDVQQIEVLRGPQNLFFGKSTTAGTVSVHTADPTPTFQSEFNLGYEVVADEAVANGYVSGPITDQLGIRLAGYFSDQKGWFYNPNPDPTIDHRLGDRDYGGRLTLKFDSGTGLRARLKVTGTHDSGDQLAGTLNQAINCPTGVRQNPFYRFDDCKIDQYNQGNFNGLPYNASADLLHAYINGNIADFQKYSPIPAAGDGRPYTRTTTWNGSFQLAYDVAPGVTITSLTGYNHVSNVDSVTASFGSAGDALSIPNVTKAEDFSEELRVASNWTESPINFTIGALYAPSKIDNIAGVSIPDFAIYNITHFIEKSRIWSAFGQLLFKPTSQIEIDVGGRYTRVKKFFDYATVESPLSPDTANVNEIGLLPKSAISKVENNFSPEATVLFRPDDTTTIYASYKQGYKGFGFNTQTFLIASLAPTPAQIASGQYPIYPFNGEKVHGFEGGIKTALFDRQLNVRLTPYWYKYTNLQVSFFEFDSNTSVVGNAAAAETKGVELGLDLQPRSVPGLFLTASAAYNDARYTDYPNAPCWGGQDVATGCSIDQTATANGVQNLSGHHPYEAPQWILSLGGSYRFPVAKDYGMELTGHVNYSSSYITASDGLPGSIQDAYATVDASVRVGKLDGPWEVAVIGRNLTNKRFIISGNDAGTATPGVQGDAFGFVDRGRQVLFQLTIRPEKF